MIATSLSRMPASQSAGSSRRRISDVPDVARPDAFTRRSLGARLLCAGLLLLGAAFYIVCLKVAQVDPAKLLAGLPRLASWTARAWPPSEFDTLLLRAAETVAMGTVGTSFA